MNKNRTLKLAALLLALLLAVAPMGALAEEMDAIEIDGAPGLEEAVAQSDLSGLELDISEPVAEEPVPVQEEALAENAAVAINSKNFPDKVFRAYVKENFDTDGNGKLSKAEINAVTAIDVCDMGIANLKGVERFTNLESLSCKSNKLKSLDIRKNTKLWLLSCSFNALTKLDVSKNTKLTYLDCSVNKLKTLVVSKLKLLESLNCESNALTELDVSKNTKLTTLNCFDNKLKALNVSRNTKLESLYCSFNALTKLDVSKNTKLTTLDCSDNKLKTLDVSKCKALTDLVCSENALARIDVSKNTALERLSCSQNALDKLTLGSTKKLRMLFTWDTKLKTIDLKGCPILKALAKKKPSERIGDSIWWENETDESIEVIAIDDTTKLTDGSKVLYKGA